MNTCVCQSCVLKFNEYDELVSRAEAIQLDLTQLLMEARQPIYAEDDDSQDDPIAVKNEDDGDDAITFEPIYFEENADEIDPSLLHEDYQMEVVVDDTNNSSEPSQMPSTRKGLKAALNSSFKETVVKQENRNYVVVELENNQRAFQCDICSKAFKDRSKLKSHREIHTTERNVICKVFKLLRHFNLFCLNVNFILGLRQNFQNHELLAKS